MVLKRMSTNCVSSLIPRMTLMTLDVCPIDWPLKYNLKSVDQRSQHNVNIRVTMCSLTSLCNIGGMHTVKRNLEPGLNCWK